MEEAVKLNPMTACLTMSVTPNKPPSIPYVVFPPGALGDSTLAPLPPDKTVNMEIGKLRSNNKGRK
jgi:hypothetical protein